MKEHFPEPEGIRKFIRNPFSTISQAETNSPPASGNHIVNGLASDGGLKVAFSGKSLSNFWIHVRSEYPELPDTAAEQFLPFPTTCNCEFGF
jgi:hypothetical protein